MASGLENQSRHVSKGIPARIASFDDSGRVTAHSEMIIPPPAQRCATWMYNALTGQVPSYRALLRCKSQRLPPKPEPPPQSRPICSNLLWGTFDCWASGGSLPGPPNQPWVVHGHAAPRADFLVALSSMSSLDRQELYKRMTLSSETATTVIAHDHSRHSGHNRVQQDKLDGQSYNEINCIGRVLPGCRTKFSILLKN